jgi:hypothetical protein
VVQAVCVSSAVLRTALDTFVGQKNFDIIEMHGAKTKIQLSCSTGLPTVHLCDHKLTATYKESNVIAKVSSYSYKTTYYKCNLLDFYLIK